MIGAYTFRLVCRPFQVGLLAIMFNAVLTLTLLPAEAKSPVKLVAFGDSLTAGYLLKT